MPFGFPSQPSSTQPSPRSSRRARPLPFVTMPAPQSFYSQFNDSSRPHSPSFYRTTVAQVQATLYGGKDRTNQEIVSFVEECYDSNACFENPLTLANGHASIAEMFSLLHVVPGTMFSELGDIAESQSYDGNRLVVMQHTLHVQFLPFLDPSHTHLVSSPSSTHLNRVPSFFSLPTTPHPQSTPPVASSTLPAMTPTVNPEATRGIFSKTRSAGEKSASPIGQIISTLSPKNLAVTLTTLHLRLHTRLLFNEHGKIIRHEDTWGIKEMVEGVFPIVGHVYELQRRGLGALAGIAARTISSFQKSDSATTGTRSLNDIRDEETGRAGMITPESCPIEDEGHLDYSAFYAPGSPAPTRKSSVSSNIDPLTMHHPSSKSRNHNYSHNQKEKAISHGLGLHDDHYDRTGAVNSNSLAQRLDQMSPEREKPTTIDSD